MQVSRAKPAYVRIEVSATHHRLGGAQLNSTLCWFRLRMTVGPAHYGLCTQDPASRILVGDRDMDMDLFKIGIFDYIKIVLSTVGTCISLYTIIN